MLEGKCQHLTSEEGNVILLAKVFSAAVGNSMSISCRSWLKRFRVTPESVLTKKDMGALRTVLSSAKWNFSPDNGTIVMIICLGKARLGPEQN